MMKIAREKKVWKGENAGHHVLKMFLLVVVKSEDFVVKVKTTMRKNANETIEEKGQSTTRMLNCLFDIFIIGLTKTNSII